MLLVGVMGLASAVLAHQPVWALTELALAISCCAIAVTFSRVRRKGDESLDRVLILFVLLLCLIKSIQYLHAGILAFSSGAAVLDPDLLLSGFSNKRFYGQ
ncbi:pilus assembly protein, partial [Pseudomonas gingeri]|nr:pilus assembly protein [Pseudomonas gingeri]